MFRFKFGSKCWRELGRTIRAAIKGWPETVRLICIMTAATVMYLIIHANA